MTAALAAQAYSNADIRRGFITVLGVPSLEWGDRMWALPAKAFAIIALLSTQPNYSLSRNRVRGFLWGEFDQEKANANLRQTLARVRKLELQIGTVILRNEPHSITLNFDAFEVDLTNAIAVDVPKLIQNRDWQRLEEFVATLSCDILSGVEFSEAHFEDWRTEVENRLQRDAVLALASLIETMEGGDVLIKRQTLARRLLNIDPTEEVGYRVLMETYEAQSERSLALQTYQRCRKVLREELGVAPDATTRRLAASLGFTEFARPREESPTYAANHPRAIAQPRDEAATVCPRVVLLPPSVVAEDETVTRVATALVEDVISGLSRCRSFAVVAPHTSIRMAETRVEWDSKLKIRYAVNATVKPMSSGLAASFRLTNYETGTVLWAIELKFDFDNLPILFSRLSHQVIYSLADAIERAELCFPFAAKDATAYRLYLEGRAAMSGSDLPNLRRARSWYRRSIDQFESYAPAVAGLSRTMSMEWLVRGLTSDEMLKQALALADHAIELDPFDGRGMRERGFSCLYLKRHEESLYSFEKAAELNPSDADLFADYADALAHSGQPKIALEKCLKAMEFNPLAPDYYNWILGSIYYQNGNYETAIHALEPVKHHPGTARLLAACSAMAGQTEEAHRYAAVVKETYPEFRLEYLSRIVPDRFARDTQHLIEGLRRAGLE